MRTIVLVVWSMACVPKSPTVSTPSEAVAPAAVVESADFAEAWTAFDASRPASFWEPMNEDAIRGVEDEGLRRLLHEHWEWTMRRSPTWATSLGDHRFDAQLSDGSEAGVAAWRSAREGWLQRAEAIDGLAGVDALTRELLVAELQTGLATDVCRFRHWSLLPRSSPLVTINSIPEDLEVGSVVDGQNLLSRYRGAPRLLQDEIDSLRLGLADGLVANAHSVGLVLEMLDKQLAEPVESWPLWLPLEATYPDWDPEVAAAWRAEMDAVVRAQIGPALATYRDFLRAEVLPVARPADQTGLSELPHGVA